MNKILKIVSLSIVFFITNTKYVISKEYALDEEQIIKILIERNKSLIASKSKLNISDAEIINAQLIPNTNFLLDFSPVQNTYRVGLGHLIELGEKRNLRIEVAQQKKNLNNISFLIELRDLKYKALKEFYNIIYLRNKQQKIDELIKISEENLSLTQKKYLAGDIPKLDINNIELKKLILKNEYFKILNELKISENILSNILDTNISKSELVININKDLCFKSLINDEKIVLNNLELIELSKKQDLINTQEKMYLENIKPNINLNYGLDTVTDFSQNSNQKLNLGSFISANMELSTNNKQQGNLYEVDKTKEFLEKDKERVLQLQKLEYLNAKQNYNNYLITKQNYQDLVLPNIRNNIEKVRISFKEGKSNIFSLIIAQQNLIDAEIELTNIINNLNQSILELKKAGNCL